MSSVANPSSSGLERDARRMHADDKPLSPGSVAIGVVIGRTSEFFDFFVYGLGSILVFPKLIFPFAGSAVSTSNRNPPVEIEVRGRRSEVSFLFRGPSSFFCPLPSALSPLASEGSTIGIASLHCTPGGIGNTSRSSRMLPLLVWLGNHHGVVVSPARMRRCQKMCTRPLSRDPARNASGTNPIDSQNRFASMSCAHQQQNSLHPHAARSNIALISVAPINPRCLPGTTQS